MTEFRKEHDSLGVVMVPQDKYWGAQTERSLENFPQESDRMPMEQIRAIALVKKAAAMANDDKCLLPEGARAAICQSADEVIEGKLDDHFPLTVWQTGSGTQTNMNVNEVLAHRGNEILGKDLLHPNDHINKSQSSNDVFPAAMHITLTQKCRTELLPALEGLIQAMDKKAQAYRDLVKCGRTHLQDATPVTLGQELSAYVESLRVNKEAIEEALVALAKLPIGGTAVGTGLNAFEGYDQAIVAILNDLTGLNFSCMENKFHGLSSKTEVTRLSAAMKNLAMDLFKMANDIRFLASGPRCGIGELRIPANEPGSSIMPGKVNPTQVESLTMIAIQVLAGDLAISFGQSQGQAQLNAYMPLIIYNALHSMDLLAKGMTCFRLKLVEGLEANEAKIQANLEASLMLVTALSPSLGYEKAAEIAHYAFENNLTLKAAAMEVAGLNEEEFDRAVDPKKMVQQYTEKKDEMFPTQKGSD